MVVRVVFSPRPFVLLRGTIKLGLLQVYLSHQRKKRFPRRKKVMFSHPSYLYQSCVEASLANSPLDWGDHHPYDRYLEQPSPVDQFSLRPHYQREMKVPSTDDGYGSSSAFREECSLEHFDAAYEEVFYLEMGDECSGSKLDPMNVPPALPLPRSLELDKDYPGYPVASAYQKTLGHLKTPGDSPPSKQVVLHGRLSFVEDQGLRTGKTKIDTFQNTNDYSDDVHAWKLGLEERFAPKDVLTFQTDINQEMRKTLLQWLVAVNRQFEYSLDTWCLTVNVMERFLSVQLINRDCLQLVGLTSFFIAAKHEEVEPPEISELVSLCARSYEPKQFMWMEFIILSHLKFELMAPSVSFFLWHLIDQDDKRRKVWPLDFTRKLIERLLCESRFSRVLPSKLARSLYEFLTRNFVMTCLVANITHGSNMDANVVNNFFQMLYLALANEDDL